MLLSISIIEEEEACNHTLAGKDCAEKETYKFLRCICSELQLMRKEMSAQKNLFLANDKDWNRSVRLIERALCITRTLISVLFLAYIVQQWTTE